MDIIFLLVNLALICMYDSFIRTNKSDVANVEDGREGKQLRYFMCMYQFPTINIIVFYEYVLIKKVNHRYDTQTGATLIVLSILLC